MRRREFIRLVIGSAVVRPLPLYAQQPGKLPTIGFMGDGATVYFPWVTAFADRLREMGWIEGQTVAIERRWSDGRPERVAEIAAEFVRQKVDVIVSYGAAVVTLKQATTSIPIVFAGAVDPVGIGIVASLSHPGGNVTGLSIQQAEIASKRLELLHRVVPKLRRLAILFDGSYRGSLRELENVRTSGRALGFEVAEHQIRGAADIAPVLDAISDHADALYIVENSLIHANGPRIVALALKLRLPTTFTSSDLVEAGALMAYGPNFPALFRRAADYVDKILRGAKPGELPVEQPTQFDLVINLKTANALGLTIPHDLLALADQVIE